MATFAKVIWLVRTFIVSDNMLALTLNENGEGAGASSYLNTRQFAFVANLFVVDVLRIEKAAKRITSNCKIDVLRDIATYTRHLQGIEFAANDADDIARSV